MRDSQATVTPSDLPSPCRSDVCIDVGLRALYLRCMVSVKLAETVSALSLHLSFTHGVAVDAKVSDS